MINIELHNTDSYIKYVFFVKNKEYKVFIKPLFEFFDISIFERPLYGLEKKIYDCRFRYNNDIKSGFVDLNWQKQVNDILEKFFKEL